MPDFSVSDVKAIDYRPARRELLVRFASGEQFAYACVPADLHADFARAESKRRFFALHIRNRYPTRRVGLGRKSPSAA